MKIEAGQWAMGQTPENLHEEIVLANRILANEGVLDAFGHVSARDPADAGAYFLSCSRSPAMVEAGDIMRFGLDGSVLEGNGKPYLERVIHGAIFEARADVHCVVHHHAPSVLPFAITAEPLRPVFHLGAVAGAEVPVWDSQDEFGDTSLLVDDLAMARSLAGAAATVKDVMLELGGKNALIACPDADIEKTANGIVAGMNFAWCGQSCGSTSRAFLHEDIHDAVLARVAELCTQFKPGDPTLPSTTMGTLINRSHQEKVLALIETAKREGARLVCGGGVPADPELARGCYVEPTIFADVEPGMTIAREEIFGPVLAVLRWSDEDRLVEDVNGVEYGLTCSIWTRDLARAHRLCAKVEAGYVWVNKAGPHFLGAPFGGVKQSGIGREECLGELLSFTREKNIHIAFD